MSNLYVASVLLRNWDVDLSMVSVEDTKGVPVNMGILSLAWSGLATDKRDAEQKARKHILAQAHSVPGFERFKVAGVDVIQVPLAAVREAAGESGATCPGDCGACGYGGVCGGSVPAGPGRDPGRGGQNLQ